MRNEFNNLVETLKRWDLFQNDDDVAIALSELEQKIIEVEKRMAIATLCANDFKTLVAKFTEQVDNYQPINLSVNDHDAMLNGANDVIISLDLGDNMCVSDNWHNMFAPKQEVEPIVVGNIEYEFPEEVYTIGNVDNTEIIGDVYESIFKLLLEAKVIITENDNGFPSGHGKANYVITHEQFIPLIKIYQIDLSKVPIKKEVFMTFDSSWGEIDCDRDGNVLEIRGDEYIGDERSYLYDIAKFDIAEYGKFCESENITMGEAEDILYIGFWKKNGEYSEADRDRRNGLNIFGDEIAPTMQCRDTHTFDKVKHIISLLKILDNGDCVDGETMEYILKQVGMQDQMLKQLFAQTTNDEIDYLLDVRNGKA